jgi:hypothetical protein
MKSELPKPTSTCATIVVASGTGAFSDFAGSTGTAGIGGVLAVATELLPVAGWLWAAADFALDLVAGEGAGFAGVAAFADFAASVFVIFFIRKSSPQ